MEIDPREDDAASVQWSCGLVVSSTLDGTAKYLSMRSVQPVRSSTAKMGR